MFVKKRFWLQCHLLFSVMMMLATFVVLVFLLKESFATLPSGTRGFTAAQVEDAKVVSPLEVFEVQAPLRSSYTGTSCQQVILQHDLAASYGSPYVGSYSPPKNCSFTSTVFNISIKSTGINYDRLGLIFFGDIELWRLTTAMPVRTGIFWNYQKDMTAFDTLLRSNQKVIMQLDNLSNSVFTGNYNVKITAMYYNDRQTLSPADEIMAISSKSSAKNASSVLSVPDQNATVHYEFPRNLERAVVSVLASGNGAEEFWFTNVPTTYMDTFNNTSIYGYSPFREVQVWIDEDLAGVGWPFPTIFTGGISPGLWVPVVGIHTYDLPSFEVDISPFLGRLCDGKSHKFQLKVVGYDTKTILGTVGSNWWVTGSIFLWLDAAGNQTTATGVKSYNGAPEFQFTPKIRGSAAANTSLWVELQADRTVRHTSTVTTSSGSRKLTWSQELSYTNIQNFTAKGHNETLYQVTSGSSSFSSYAKNSTSTTLITSTYSYPISLYQAYTVPTNATTTNTTLYAELDRGLSSSSIPILSYLTSPSNYRTPQTVQSRLNGSCLYFWNNTYYEFAGAIDPANGTDGATEQWFSSKGPVQGGAIKGYGRHVKAADGYEPVLVLDEKFTRTIDVPDLQVVRGENL